MSLLDNVKNKASHQLEPEFHMIAAFVRRDVKESGKLQL